MHFLMEARKKEISDACAEPERWGTMRGAQYKVEDAVG